MLCDSVQKRMKVNSSVCENMPLINKVNLQGAGGQARQVSTAACASPTVAWVPQKGGERARSWRGAGVEALRTIPLSQSSAGA
jgi:hypothetical protein